MKKPVPPFLAPNLFIFLSFFYFFGFGYFFCGSGDQTQGLAHSG
jgi:hypothetical protein